MKTVGFISPPGWFDPSPEEFPKITAEPARTQQCPLYLPEFNWSLESISKTEPQQTDAAHCLASMGCDVIAKVGTPFAWAGMDSVREARDRSRRLSDAAGVPVVMTGIALVDACHALGTEKVALACTYYSSDWKSQWMSYIHASGIHVVAARNLADHGLAQGYDDPADETNWAPTEEQITQTVLKICEEAPDTEAVAISGAGARTLALTGKLEEMAGRAVFGADTALYWAAAQAAGIKLMSGILGRLTDTRPVNP